ncbi:hypothetical protein ACF0H5_011615 [Mactra antiquata]
MPALSKLYNSFRAQIGTEGLAGETELDVKCISCTRRERVCKWEDVSKGSHIIMKGENFMLNVGGKQMSPYTHHAIVKEVVHIDINSSSASVKLIHFFSTPYDMTLRVQETTELLDLHYHQVYILRYRHQTHSPERIVERAESILVTNATVKYYLFSCNCEHFCNWCSVGQEESFQVETLESLVRSMSMEVGSLLGKLLRILLQFAVVSVEDLSAVAARTVCAVPWGVLSVFALIYLLLTAWKHHKLDEKQKRGIICSACCLRRKQELWMTFFTYCVFQVGGLGLISFLIAIAASKGIVIAALIGCSILSISLMNLVPKIRKYLGSPFEGRLVRVTSLNKVWVGDVISIDHWKMSHDAIVSSVNIIRGTRKKKGSIRVIHYALPSIFGQRRIVEEEIDIDLTRHFIKGHDYSGYNVHPPEIVVERARKRIGETKFGLMSNRSCHFCHWAKVDEKLKDDDDATDAARPLRSELLYVRSIKPGETLSSLRSIHVNHKQNRKPTTKLMEKTWVRIRDDLKPGMVISFKFRTRWHKAICTAVLDSPDSLSKLIIGVVHYGKNCIVSEESFEFDLNTQDIWIYRYHPIYRFDYQTIIRRARARMGNQDYNMLLHRSSHLVEEIALKETDRLITDIDEVQLGDVILMMYWGLTHAAVVTWVRRAESKPNTIGRIKIIHYALDSLFSTRYIKEETIPVDLQKDMIWLKNYSGYSTYPPTVVVKRARNRIDEKRFNFVGNTSWDFVHWAKVIQTPGIMVKPSQNDDSVEEEFVIVPVSGECYDGFQRHRACAWMDLREGTIVEYSYYWIWHQGILTRKDETSKTISVIHYGASHIFASRTIIEDTWNVDLKHDNIWIYDTDPRKCNRASVIVDNARMRLGEQRWCSGNRSWDFCKDCVLKKTSKET